MGGGVIKQRIARENGGKSGGFRSIIFFKAGNSAFFVYGFAKNERDNISANDLRDFKKFALEVFNYSDDKISILLAQKALIEVKYEK